MVNVYTPNYTCQSHVHYYLRYPHFKTKVYPTTTKKILVRHADIITKKLSRLIHMTVFRIDKIASCMYKYKSNLLDAVVITACSRHILC